ncbi:MAG: FecCD family ABC transporter permease [Kiritimatiellia bacterium]|jgi:iron complex transport system permease protein
MKRFLPVLGVAVGSLAISALCVFIGPHFTLPGAGGLPANLLAMRLCRVATAFAVGAALASSGVVFQAVLRNPLADPYVLGVSAGAALGAAATIVSGIAAASPFALPAGAFLAAVVSLALVVALSSGRRAVSSEAGLILCGVIVSAMATSLLMVLQTFSSEKGLLSITWWMLGSLQSTPPRLLAIGTTASFAGFLAAWWMARDLDVLTLGGEMAHHLGVKARRTALLALAAGTLSAAAAVAMAGLIGFVGLIVPHAVRRILGAGHRRLLPACLFAGGAFLVLCDTFARAAFSPRELPVGVVTALLGGPFFLVLLRRRR